MTSVTDIYGETWYINKNKLIAIHRIDKSITIIDEETDEPKEVLEYYFKYYLEGGLEILVDHLL